MNISDYWIEAVRSALEDIERLDILSDEDIKSLAQNLQNSSEQQSMAFGFDVIPNPLKIEIEKQKSKYESEIKRLENRDRIFRKNVANRHGFNVSPEDVYIDGEDIYYDKKGLG